MSAVRSSSVNAAGDTLMSQSGYCRAKYCRAVSLISARYVMVFCHVLIGVSPLKASSRRRSMPLSWSSSAARNSPYDRIWKLMPLGVWIRMECASSSRSCVAVAGAMAMASRRTRCASAGVSSLRAAVSHAAASIRSARRCRAALTLGLLSMSLPTTCATLSDRMGLKSPCSL